CVSLPCPLVCPSSLPSCFSSLSLHDALPISSSFMSPTPTMAVMTCQPVPTTVRAPLKPPFPSPRYRYSVTPLRATSAGRPSDNVPVIVTADITCQPEPMARRVPKPPRPFDG